MRRKIHTTEFIAATLGGIVGAALILAFASVPIKTPNHVAPFAFFSGLFSAVIAIFFCFASRQRSPNPEFGEITCESLRIIERDRMGEATLLVYLGNDYQHGGEVKVFGKSGGEAQIRINKYGGQVYVWGKSNHETWNTRKAQANMGVDERENGAVKISDKFNDHLADLK